MSALNIIILHCFLISTLISSCLTATISDCKGCVTLDQQSFDKIQNKYEVLVVKFDVAFPYGDKHSAFLAVADGAKYNPDIMFAEVGVKHYGLRQNMEFAKNFEINSEEDMPTIRVFVQGEDEPFAYEKNRVWTEEDIKKFLRDHTNIYFGLPGCLAKFDKLATDFSNSDDKQEILQKAENEASKIRDEKEKKSAENYIKYMKKIIHSETFVLDEKRRLQKLLSDAKISQNKKEDLSHRLNILQSFAPVRTEL